MSMKTSKCQGYIEAKLAMQQLTKYGKKQDKH